MALTPPCETDGSTALATVDASPPSPTRERVVSYLPVDTTFAKEEFPFYWLARVQAAYSMEMERVLKPVGIDIPSWRALLILEEGACSVSEIALHSVAKLSTVTKLVQRMRDEGLVETAPWAEDNRVTVVNITEAGHQAIHRGRLATAHLFSRSFDGLTAGQIKRLNETLRQLLDNVSPRHGEAAAGRLRRKMDGGGAKAPAAKEEAAPKRRGRPKG